MNEYIKNAFFKTYGRKPEYIFSAPGRTEISGNHTDHQLGCVLAGAVELDIRAAVAINHDGIIRVLSEGHSIYHVDLSDLSIHPEEKNTAASLIRGTAARIKELGHEITGFDAYVTSTVMQGSGLSSSAAFEVLIGTVLNGLCDCGLSPEEIAQIGQYAENVYFGKPCGLMDQMASSVGGIIGIDFEKKDEPKITALKFDFSRCGYDLCVIDSRASHADLTDEYAHIPEEMERVCALFGEKYLRRVDESEFYRRLAEVRAAAGDRATLRAIHVFEENKRVRAQIKALEQNDFDEFLRLVRESGLSSWRYLQNVTPAGRTENQELAFALCYAEKLLGGRGACRVHGGGFAGTMQAFVPHDMTEDFRREIDRVLGEGACKVLSIRKEGGIRLE